MDCKLIGLLCFFFSVAVARVSVEFSSFDTSTDKCPEVTDVTKEMPQIVNHLMKKACRGMVITLRGMGRKVRGECSKTSFHSLCSASIDFPTKFECSVTAHHMNFVSVKHTDALSAEEPKMIKEASINHVVLDIVVELQEGSIVRVTDVTSFKADIPGLREPAIQQAIFAGLKAAAGEISCSLA